MASLTEGTMIRRTNNRKPTIRRRLLPLLAALCLGSLVLSSQPAGAELVPPMEENDVGSFLSLSFKYLVMDYDEASYNEFSLGEGRNELIVRDDESFFAAGVNACADGEVLLTGTVHAKVIDDQIEFDSKIHILTDSCDVLDFPDRTVTDTRVLSLSGGPRSFQLDVKSGKNRGQLLVFIDEHEFIDMPASSLKVVEYSSALLADEAGDTSPAHVWGRVRYPEEGEELRALVDAQICAGSELRGELAVGAEWPTGGIPTLRGDVKLFEEDTCLTKELNGEGSFSPLLLPPFGSVGFHVTNTVEDAPDEIFDGNGEWEAYVIDGSAEASAGPRLFSGDGPFHPVGPGFIGTFVFDG